MTSVFARTILDGKDQVAQTPPTMLKIVDRLYFGGRGFYDPCPVRPVRDGLKTPWRARNYVNPEFKQIRLWAEKAVSEPGVTVMLMPARVGTRYQSEVVLPNAVSIIIWSNRIAFPPHEGHLGIPIITVQIHGSAKMHPVPGLVLHPLRFDYWRLPHGLPREVRAAVRRKYGTNVNYTIVMEGPRATVLRIAQRCRGVHAILVQAQILNASWLLQCLPVMREVVFISPALKLAGSENRSFQGSILLVLSDRPLPNSIRPLAARVPKCYLAVFRDGRTIGPD